MNQTTKETWLAAAIMQVLTEQTKGAYLRLLDVAEIELDENGLAAELFVLFRFAASQGVKQTLAGKEAIDAGELLHILDTLLNEVIEQVLPAGREGLGVRLEMYEESIEEEGQWMSVFEDLVGEESEAFATEIQQLYEQVFEQTIRLIQDTDAAGTTMVH
ncbi:hypothetical protein [Marinicrinis sediminis]|uniref:DUF4375 domain-containing protein n=1 Tax=Marinicrinis sediminis TaxID=1652465 RepID=A0ABW5RE22_9BACL